MKDYDEPDADDVIPGTEYDQGGLYDLESSRRCECCGELHELSGRYCYECEGAGCTAGDARHDHKSVRSFATDPSASYLASLAAGYGADHVVTVCGYCMHDIEMSPSGAWSLDGENARSSTVCDESPDRRHIPGTEDDW